jgi:hypothetical protein
MGGRPRLRWVGGWVVEVELNLEEYGCEKMENGSCRHSVMSICLKERQGQTVVLVVEEKENKTFMPFVKIEMDFIYFICHECTSWSDSQ